MLKQYAANRKRQLLALPNVSPYIYTTLKFLALKGAPPIYDISRLRVKLVICFASRTVHFVNNQNQQIQQLFIQFINYVW
jgi:hypothetical protein